MIDKFIDKIIDLIGGSNPDLPKTGDLAWATTLISGNPIYSIGQGLIYNNVTFRVIVRGSKDNTALQKAEAIYNTLNDVTNVDYTGGHIIKIVASDTPNYAYRDENDRVLYNTTFIAKIQAEEE